MQGVGCALIPAVFKPKDIIDDVRVVCFLLAEELDFSLPPNINKGIEKHWQWHAMKETMGNIDKIMQVLVVELSTHMGNFSDAEHARVVANGNEVNVLCHRLKTEFEQSFKACFFGQS